ncbi:MAG: MFS transporter, partial [Lachnospiraceae bacterium]|nr:MFS transporter [Lachnospiraceae bacterium]
FSRTPVWWCLGQFIGWFLVPLMSTNLDVILRATIPVEMQGRVYSCRNTLQFFTIPIGFLLGGVMVDRVCEPFMAGVPVDSLAASWWGVGKGSGAAMMMFILGVAGTVICLVFGQILKKYTFCETVEGEE